MNVSGLQAIALSIAQVRSVDEILKMIATSLACCPNVVLARLWLVKPGDICGECALRVECLDQTRCLHLVASAGASVTGADHTRLNGAFRRFPIGVRKIGRVAKTGEPLLLTDVTPNQPWIVSEEWAAAEKIQSFAAQPLVFRDEVLGVLAVFDRGQLGQEDFDCFRTLAAQAAIAIANARAFEEVEQLRRRLEQENDYLQEEVREALDFGEIIGASTALQKVLKQIDLVAPTEANVLIQGESGTGKELIARAIHERSPRRQHPLIKVNCGAIPDNLFESEFFGHVRGAFTGAVKDRIGRFQLADGGTLFLDEVGEIPPALQAKLLRVLQEQQFERVGEDRTRKVNVRIVAATNRDLKADVEAGRFRQDLFYRLTVFPIEVPTLRERREDIPPLAAHFLKAAARKMNCKPSRLTQGHVAQLQAYDWPGNVRELQNVIERAVILAQGGSLRFDLLSSPARTTPTLNGASTHEFPLVLTRAELKRRERDSIRAALAKTDGKVFGRGGAAELLAMKPTTLASRIKSLGLKRR